MFNFFQAVFAKVTSFIVGVVVATGLVSPPMAHPQATSTEPITQMVIQEESATSTQLRSEIEGLRKEADEARKEADTERLKAAKATAEAGKAKAESEAARVASEQQRLQAENEKLKTEAAATAMNAKSTQDKPVQQGTLCNGKYWAQCTSGQSFVCPSTGNAYCTSGTSNVQKGKNYRIATIDRLNSVIAIEEAYVNWLQDTSDQFRATSLTLSSYQATGGLYAESRALAISLANKEVGVISSLMSSARERIASLKSVLGTLNQDSNQFVDEITYGKLLSPNAIEADIAEVRKSFDETLAEVMVALQWH